MKEEEKTTDPKKIIMNDGELMASIEEIVNRSVKKGYKKTDVFDVISNTWKKSKPKYQCAINLTDEEKVFFDKAENFVTKYGEELFKSSLWERMSPENRKYEDIERIAKEHFYKERFISDLRIYIKCVYCVFLREKSITRKQLRKYSNELFGEKTSVPFDEYTLEIILDDFIFIEETEPIYDFSGEKRKLYENWSTFRSKCLVHYEEFVAKYKFRNSALNRASMRIIWLISTYY